MRNREVKEPVWGHTAHKWLGENILVSELCSVAARQDEHRQHDQFLKPFVLPLATPGHTWRVRLEHISHPQGNSINPWPLSPTPIPPFILGDFSPPSLFQYPLPPLPGGASLAAQKVICLQCRRPRFNPWVGKITWRREWQPTPGFLSGEFHGQRSLAGHSSWVTRSQTRLRD